MVQSCVNLRELNLTWTSLSKRGVKCLVTNLTPKIEKLSLSSESEIKDEHVLVLVNRCNKITELDLKYTSITSKSISHICKYLKSLVKLNLGEAKIESVALLKLGILPNISVLVNNSSDICNLRSQMPKLRIEAKEDFKIAKLQIQAQQIKRYSFNHDRYGLDSDDSEFEALPNLYSGSDFDE